MARSRNIKPGFFRNADLAELPVEARLLFIGLWTIADRSGRLEDRPKQIKMEIFPADSFDCAALLDLLADIGMIARYEAHGIRCIQVINFDKHQNPHRDERASTLPDQCGNYPETVQKQKKNDVSTVQAPCEQDASTMAIGLNPESLFTDSLIPDSLTEDTPDKPARSSRAAKTLKTYLDECKASAVKPIPDDHFIRTYFVDVGINDDMAALAWVRFREEHTTGTRKAKKYTDWPAAFANSVKDRWYKLWTVNANGDADWTPAGMQERRAQEARQEAKRGQA